MREIEQVLADFGVEVEDKEKVLEIAEQSETLYLEQVKVVQATTITTPFPGGSACYGVMECNCDH